MADNSNTLTLTLQIKDDGSVTVETVKKKVDDLEKSTTSGGKSIADVLGSVKAAWLGVAGAAVAGYEGIKQFLDAASEAEQIESRMAFQLSAVGYQFQEIKLYVDEFADSILKATRFSDEMARQGLGQMMQYTPDVEKAMKGVKLAMDMATQTGQDLGSTTRFVGMAMSGNAEILGRWIPELRDLDSKLGSSATSAEKAAYAIDVLNKKFSGASIKDMETYAGKVQNLKNQWDELKESVGKTLLPTASAVVKGALMPFQIASLGNIPSYAEIAAQDEAKRKAIEQARIASVAKAAEDELALWKGMQEQRQGINFSFAMQELQLRKKTLQAIDAEEYIALEKAKKYKADENQIRTVYHLKRLEQIRKEKEEEMNSMLSLATMWQSYYSQKITKQNEAIGLVQGTGIQTTVGARFQFAGVEDEFRKVAEQAGMLTKEELEKLKAYFIAKIDAVLPFQGGEWEEISVAIGKKTAASGFGFQTEYGTDYRWREGAMSEQESQVEAMRQASLKKLEEMFKSAAPGAAYGGEMGTKGIIESFDAVRNKALELQQTIEAIQEQKLAVDSSKIVEATQYMTSLENKILDVVNGDYKIQLSIEILGEDFLGKLESALGARISNGRSSLAPVLPGQYEY